MKHAHSILLLLIAAPCFAANSDGSQAPFTSWVDALATLIVWFAIWTWVSVTMIRTAVLQGRSPTLWLWLGLVAFYAAFMVVLFVGAMASASRYVPTDFRRPIVWGAGIAGLLAGRYSVLVLRRRLASLNNKTELHANVA